MVLTSCLALGVHKGRSRKLEVRRLEMKPSITAIIISAIFTMGANSLAVAQPSTWAEQWYRAKFGRPSPTEEARLNAAKQTRSKSTGTAPNDLAAPRNDQRMALARCMKATDQVRTQANQMQAVGRPWGRGRIGYSKNDLVALSDYRDELELALSNLAAVHQEFVKGLSEAEEQRLDQRLRKLNHLQAEFSSKIAEFDHDLLKTEPGPDSTGIVWDVNSLKRAADKWQSEHQKISKELSLQGTF